MYKQYFWTLKIYATTLLVLDWEAIDALMVGVFVAARELYVLPQLQCVMAMEQPQHVFVFLDLVTSLILYVTQPMVLVR